MDEIRHNWTVDEIRELHDMPIMELIYKAATIHRKYHEPTQVQVCSLISIKTGGCPEDCKYCPQSSRYQTGVAPEPLMEKERVLGIAKDAIKRGATRICMGAAWRHVRDSKQFDQVLELVSEVNAMGVEVCCTLGMLTEPQALRLKEAGLYAYNHNLDSSAEFYKTIISTRTYDERLNTLDVIEKAKISVCCGGIIGMGETENDRIKLIHTLATRPNHPESVPVNMLVPVPGTPLEDTPKVSIWEMVRMVAIARITMPKAMVRLSAGRMQRSTEEQALCFMAGANSIFSGEKLLVTANASFDQDQAMFDLLGLHPRPSFQEEACNV